MTRPKAFFDIASFEELPREASLRVGDILRIQAMGAKILDGPGVVEILGPLTLGTLLTSTSILPAGDPNVLLIVPRKPGQSSIQVFFGSRSRPGKAGALAVTVAQ